MRTLTWQLEDRSQAIDIGAGSLASVGERVAGSANPSAVFVVTDGIVAEHYADKVLNSLQAAGLRAHLVIVPPGESSKSLEQAAKLYDGLASVPVGRDGAVLALGGGMITDLAGFVAATWLRGVTLISCPTSLEACIDAALGGKTGLDHPAGKNLIGAFHPAARVVIDPMCLSTLPRRELVAGLAESIKHALIEDAAFLAWHEEHREAILACKPAAMEELIARNAAIKMGIVCRDFRETLGLRAALNFGHTLGHAIEASCGYALRHGECVALGMVAAARISQAMGLLSAGDAGRVADSLASFGLPTSWGRLAPAEDLLAFVARDKKTAAARLRWVLLAGLGRTVIRDGVPAEAVRAAIESLR